MKIKSNYLKDEIGKKLIGHKKAIEDVSNIINVNMAGLTDETRPLASLLFMGPTGVGKTELAKGLADVLYGGKNEFTRFDMSEYSHEETFSRFIGTEKSPGDILRVKKENKNIILFDEIEKANKAILDLFLQILDEGHVTMANGIKINFQGKIIILTSNIGSFIFEDMILSPIKYKNQDGVKMRLRLELEKNFRIELVNRFDEIVIFETLTEEMLSKIFDIRMNELKNRVFEKKKIKFNVDDFFKRNIISEIKNGPEKKYGARPLNRILKQKVLPVIANGILDGDIIEGDEIELKYDLVKNELTIEKELEI